MEAICGGTLVAHEPVVHDFHVLLSLLVRQLLDVAGRGIVVGGATMNASGLRLLIDGQILPRFRGPPILFIILRKPEFELRWLVNV